MTTKMDPGIIQLCNAPWPGNLEEGFTFAEGTTAQVKDGYVYAHFPDGGHIISGPEAKIIGPDRTETFLVPILLQSLQDHNISVNFL